MNAQFQTVMGVCYLYFLTHPTTNAWRMLEDWDDHPVLADYRKPDRPYLERWIEEFVSWRSDLLHGRN